MKSVYYSDHFFNFVMVFKKLTPKAVGRRAFYRSRCPEIKLGFVGFYNIRSILKEKSYTESVPASKP